MKKKLLISLGITSALIIIAGITLFVCHNSENPAQNFIAQTSENENIYHKTFGSYELPENWIESKKYSTSTKFFYVLKSQESSETPNNISINRGTNKYPKTDHEKFKAAILSQLSMQISQKENLKINANGSYNDNGDVVYTFTIEDSNDDVMTTQYYIVGDYEYILIHETVFGKSDETKLANETDAAAKQMINTFKWN